MKNILLRMAIDSISDTATTYSSYEFFIKRDEIAQKMQAELDLRLQTDLHCRVVFFQLRSIDLPDDYENAIQKTEVSKQGILQAEALRNKNKVYQETLVEASRIAKSITINQAVGRSNSTLLKAQAQADTFFNVTQSQASAYATLMQSLNLTNQELIQYLQINLIQSNQNGQIVIALNKQTSP